MATTFKTFLNDDIASTRTLLHEAIPLTGTIVSGTYSEDNIQNYSHEIFQSVYDYPFLSSSANHIFDITMGYSSGSNMSSSNDFNDKKVNVYTQMAQVLVGYHSDGVIREFDEDGDLETGTKITEAFFINFARLLTKDEIKKGSFSMTVLTGGTAGVGDLVPGVGPSDSYTITDSGSTNDFKVNSPAGEYGILYDNLDIKRGLIYYQAGVIVLTASIFHQHQGETNGVALGVESENANYFGPPDSDIATGLSTLMETASITASCDGFRNRWYDCSFNNTTELNSTIYFCRANHNDFNYSANPTYVSGSKIRIKNNMNDSPVSYITTVGLYSADNELLAVAKVSEPLKKDPTNELTLRVRLDY